MLSGGKSASSLPVKQRGSYRLVVGRRKLWRAGREQPVEARRLACRICRKILAYSLLVRPSY
jgi:hypothetical protein